MAPRVTPPYEPETLTVVVFETADVVTVKVLLVAPALTVTLPARWPLRSRRTV